MSWLTPGSEMALQGVILTNTRLNTKYCTLVIAGRMRLGTSSPIYLTVADMSKTALEKITTLNPVKISTNNFTLWGEVGKRATS